LKKLQVGQNQLRVGYLDARKQKKWLWSNKLLLPAKQRLQTFFYKAQGKEPRHPVLFHFMPEPVPKI
jgi:hypothetical protein